MLTDVDRVPGVPASIREIKNKRVRNLVRGALSAKDEAALKGTMERLRRESEPKDAAIAFGLLQESALARHLRRPAAFPEDVGEVDGLPYYSAAKLEIELVAQGLRLARDADRLVGAIEVLASINERILARDLDGVAAPFARYRSEFGASLLIAGKAISLRHMAFVGRKGWNERGDVLAPSVALRRHVVAVGLEDSVDTDRDYLQVRRSFLDFVARNRLDPADAAIVVDQFSPLDVSRFDLAQRLQAFGRWGLLDTTAYLVRLEAHLLRIGSGAEAVLVRNAIPGRVKDAWDAAFGRIDVQGLHDLIGMKDQFFERRFFAHMPAWSEYPELLAYRLRVEAAVGARLDGRFPVPTHEAAAFAAPCSGTGELLARGGTKPDIVEISPGSCGAFHRTIALAATVEAGRLGLVTGEQLSVLLDQTLDVASLFSRAELAEFLPRRPADPLYEFLRTAVVNDAEERNVSNHALRRALQKLVEQRFCGDIVRLLEHVDSENGHVSGHLSNLCTEAFLTELYDLYSEADQVMEAQASILEWRGSRKNDADARNSAKSHRLNLRLRKVRGAIDETRIYVDPLRFVQWVQEKLGGELRSLSSFADEILADPDRGVSLKDAVRVAVQPRLRLLKLLDECYVEFCTNKIYGVTSFIGRRIRHGTLHGHLVLEFRPEVQRAVEEFRHAAPRFSRFLEGWLEQFDAAVSLMAADRIHVRSKDKPRGLIVAALDDSDKGTIAAAMLDSVAGSMRDRSQIPRTLSTIQEYCWLLFEVDLKRTRDAVESLRREFAINVDQPHFSDRPEIERRVNDRIRALNASLQHRFEMVRSWLTRPTNLSPSASVALLFEAVLDEVRQRYPGFQPELDIMGAQDVELLGHRFHFFYDALYILVDNAAKHGERHGILSVRVETTNPDDKHTDVRVSVRSDLVSPAEAGARIDEAMCAEVGDAMVKDGRSGIRKLRGLVDDVEEIVDFQRRYEDGSVVFTIDMRYIRSA